MVVFTKPHSTGKRRATTCPP